MSNYLIETMPHFQGKQLYPGMFPMESGEVFVNGVSVDTRFFRKFNGKYQSEEDEKICRDFILYYLLAPCFSIVGKERKRAINASHDELLEICFDNEIDPF